MYRENEAPIVDKMLKLFTLKQCTSHFSKLKECTSYLQVHADSSCISSRSSSESVCMPMSRSLKLEAALFLSVKGLQHKSPSCTRTDSTWHIMSLTAASPVLQALPQALHPQLIISIRPSGAAGPVSSEGDGSPLFMSHPNLVMSKMGGPCRSAAFHNVTCR